MRKPDEMTGFFCCRINRFEIPALTATTILTQARATNALLYLPTAATVHIKEPTAIPLITVESKSLSNPTATWTG